VQVLRLELPTFGAQVLYVLQGLNSAVYDMVAAVALSYSDACLSHLLSVAILIPGARGGDTLVAFWQQIIAIGSYGMWYFYSKVRGERGCI
jgi:hypothetical protein